MNKLKDFQWIEEVRNLKSKHLHLLYHRGSVLVTLLILIRYGYFIDTVVTRVSFISYLQ